MSTNGGDEAPKATKERWVMQAWKLPWADQMAKNAEAEARRRANREKRRQDPLLPMPDPALITRVTRTYTTRLTVEKDAKYMAAAGWKMQEQRLETRRSGFFGFGLIGLAYMGSRLASNRSGTHTVTHTTWVWDPAPELPLSKGDPIPVGPPREE